MEDINENFLFYRYNSKPNLRHNTYYTTTVVDTGGFWDLLFPDAS